MLFRSVVMILFDDIAMKVVVFRNIDMFMVKNNSIFKVSVFKSLGEGVRAIA